MEMGRRWPFFLRSVASGGSACVAWHTVFLSAHSATHRVQGTAWVWAAGMELTNLAAGTAFNLSSLGVGGEEAYRPNAVLEIFRLGLQRKREGRHGH